MLRTGTTWVVFTAAVFGGFMSQPASADDRPDSYGIFSPTQRGEDAPSFQLVVQGSAYFKLLGFRRRAEGDKSSPPPYSSNPERSYELENAAEGLTRIKVSKTGKYLCADYEVMPPTVIERNKADDSSLWRIVPKEGSHQSYIQNKGPKDQNLWLSVGSEPILVEISGQADAFIDIRKATLSLADKKSLFEITKRDPSK